MRVTSDLVVTVVHGYSYPQRSHSCIAGLLDRNRISVTRDEPGHFRAAGNLVTTWLGSTHAWLKKRSNDFMNFGSRDGPLFVSAQTDCMRERDWVAGHAAHCGAVSMRQLF
ncbi:hypothetical protein EVAR_46719_1 [Eumeta japonica]|uniref:Uncharacterized protein n=1 Tax=Eumeta variegata TaxID=151549 RepID=A0A4C1X9M1_EUMVA|nr:hypothetical protein EVAR_46719_1 [Eumeta japonica]